MVGPFIDSWRPAWAIARLAFEAVEVLILPHGIFYFRSRVARASQAVRLSVK